MTTRTRKLAGALLAGALVLAVGSIASADSRGDRGWSMMRFGPGMMAYGSNGSGDRVDNISEARKRAKGFADRLHLRVGEVMQFSNHYYAELVKRNGRPATEVLINPRNGSVWLEFGPAMMWNTRYGMLSGAEFSGRDGMMGGGTMMGGQGGMTGGQSGMTGGQNGMTGGQNGMTSDQNGMTGGQGMMDGTYAPANGSGKVSASDARRIAARWLSENRSDLTAGEADPFPGYYTLHVLRSGRPAGMLSVNASTGAVWVHWWHGRFVRMTG